MRLLIIHYKILLKVVIKSTYKYIISKGINASRITKQEGFGESQLVNKCANNVKCSEEEHQLNRRTEFIIIKMK
ncbi:OmpA family protein [Lutibacter litoralis]|uniref:OmpA-like domain-containing protein n=2 Tax=Flavobacteriaceae TaxID=49546 RepID=A0A4Y8AP80_9FLAO|nr:hypothetical protein [Gramella jeungdoensis]TEW72426.1 hypothetical protein E2488_13300 [Gramella jeungdoensis]